VNYLPENGGGNDYSTLTPPRNIERAACAMHDLCDDCRSSKNNSENNSTWKWQHLAAEQPLLEQPVRSTLFSFHRSFRPSHQAKQSWTPIRANTLHLRPLWSKTPISGVCAKLQKVVIFFFAQHRDCNICVKNVWDFWIDSSRHGEHCKTLSFELWNWYISTRILDDETKAKQNKRK